MISRINIRCSNFYNQFYLTVKFASFLLIFFLILSGCASTRSSRLNVGNSRSLNISFHSDQDKLNLKGLSVLTKDSSYFNIYGKLGVFEMNVTRIFVFGDSIVIVDLVNKKIFRSRYGKMSQIIYNFFTGNYSIKEEQFVYAICSLFLKDINKKNKPEIDYKFTNKVKKSFIDLQLNSNQNCYFIKMKVLSNNKNDNIPFNYINKYSNFENISIEFR